MDVRRQRLSQRQLGLRATVGAKAAFIRLELAEPHRQADAGVADRAADPDLIAGARAAARRSPSGGGASDRGQPQAARGARRNPDRVPAEQRQREAAKRNVESPREILVPRRVAGQAIAEQHAERRGSLRREIGQVDRDELPRDILRCLVGQEMDALDEHVVREHQPLPDRCIVGEPARRGVGRNAAQPGDEIGFVQTPSFLAFALSLSKGRSSFSA